MGLLMLLSTPRPGATTPHALADSAHVGASPALPPEVRFAAEALRVDETAGTLTLAVLPSTSPDRVLQATVRVDGGSALLGDDVTIAATTTLTFPADRLAPQYVTLSVQPDEADEGIEYLDLSLHSDEIRIGPPARLRVWIRDEAPYPTLRAQPLIDRLQADFAAALLTAEQAADTLKGAIWPHAADAYAVASIQAGAEKKADTHPLRRDLHTLLPLSRETYASWRRQSLAAWSAETASAPLAAAGLEGDVARMLLYLQAFYPDQLDADAFAALKPQLVAWMDADPVDAAELARTTRIARLQGNANPFVLVPDLAEQAFNLRGTYPSPVLSFVRAQTAVSEADSVAVIEVAVSGMGDVPVTVEVALGAARRTLSAKDVENFRARVLTFPAGAPDGTVRRLRLPIAHDEATSESTEQAELVLRHLSGFATTGPLARHTLQVTNAALPVTPAESIVLSPAYPNPVNPDQGATVQLDLTMPEPMSFTVGVYSTLGQRVRAQQYSAGEAARLSTIEIDTRGLPSGLYIVRLNSAAARLTETFVVVR